MVDHWPSCFWIAPRYCDTMASMSSLLPFHWKSPIRENSPLKLGEGQRGVQFLPAELGEVKLKGTWLLGVKPGEKLK